MGSINKNISENGTTTKDTVDISIALSACNIEVVPSFIQEINSLENDLTLNRVELLEKARCLVRALETPRETMIKHCWAQPTCFTALAFCIQVGLFPLMAKDSSSPKKVPDLATDLGTETDLLRRIMRHIGAMGYLHETGVDEYELTNFTKSLTLPVIADGYPCIVWSCLPPLTKFHSYLKANNYETPTKMADGIYQSAHKTELNFFQHLQANPPNGEQFNHHMGGYRQGRPSWMDEGFYPVQNNLIEGFDNSVSNHGSQSGKKAALLVDIGGNLGHDCEEFLRKFPDAPGRIVLQDLPVVIAQITELDERVERMAYDFYEEQPVKGARAYYMHSVLHDWPDETCAKIVQRIKDAMKPGYSKLLINENVIMATGASWEATSLDLLMMTLFSSRERTESDWRKLLEGSCGLKICKIWKVGHGVESVIECELE